MTTTGANTTATLEQRLANLEANDFTPPVLVNGATDALPKVGSVLIQSTGVDATTLATPVSGPQEAGGDDGKVLLVIDDGGHAHTITTASNKIVPSHAILTFNGTRGSSARLIANAGLWYPIGLVGVTAS